MKKWKLTISIVALFIGIAFIPAGASVKTEEQEKDGPGWEYLVVGRIKSYEIVEYNGTEYLNCRSVHVKFIIWNIFEKFPRLPVSMKIRFGREFNIPYEGAKSIGPTILGRYFIVARGVL